MITTLIVLSACADSSASQLPTPTLDLNAVQTAVAQIQASLTQTAEAANTPTSIPTSTATLPELMEHVSETYGFAFEYSPTWSVTETILPMGTRLNQRSFNRFGAGSDKHDELVVEVTKGSEWILEIVATKSTQDCGGYSSNLLESTGVTPYQPLEILGRSAVRLRPEDGYAWKPSDFPEPYPVIVVFPNIHGECSNHDEEWSLFSFSDNQRPLSLNITYYSSQFTNDNLQNRTIDYSTLQEMDRIVESLTLR